MRPRIAVVVLFCSFAFVRFASAQVTPAAGYTPPDDTPQIRVGVTLYPTFTVQTDPKITDAEGNSVDRSVFDVTRAYINITGQISHLIAFRITPDITRQSGIVASGQVTNDSLVYRIKYAYAQFNLDDWMTRGSWVRLGIQQTPWVDFDEGIYRYRFQGTTFVERQPLLTTFTSSDGGVSFHYNLPENYGDVHIGVYNGENYQRVELNNEKGLELRATVRPFASASTPPILRGVRGHFVYYDDNYAAGDERTRLMGNVTFEHKFLNAEYDYLKAHDQVLKTSPDVESTGWAFWATPRYPWDNGSSIEALLRYDRFTPNTATAIAPASSAPTPLTRYIDQHQNRTIVGAAYWFPHQGNVSTAILLDYDGQHFDNITTPAAVKTVSIHGLVNF
ncbi:MAG TPA: porin [Vicinamibacterales bacterium]|nr:porin [Vicinamibacterales bacterium]